MVDVAMLILRLGLGIVFLAHGIKHARGRIKTSNWFASIGFTSPQFSWFMSTASEIAVGVMLILGLLTSAGVAILIGVMFVAFWTVHRTVGFWITARPDEGWEYVFTLSFAAVALAIAGPGQYSIDHGIGIAEDLDGWVGLAFVVLGVVGAVLELATFWRPASVEEKV